MCLETVPDEPEYVEARSALTAGGDVFGGPEGGVVCSGDGSLLAVFGRPSEESLREALRNKGEAIELVAAGEAGRVVESVLERPGEHADICVLEGEIPGPPSPDEDRPATTMLANDQAYRLAHTPAALGEEIRRALSQGPVAAVLQDGLPVSFCYPSAVTETYWDVSVDTLEPYRRRGLATLAFRLMAHRMRLRGRRPVWGATDENIASLRMASSLGFSKCGDVHVWALRRPPSAES